LSLGSSDDPIGVHFALPNLGEGLIGNVGLPSAYASREYRTESESARKCRQSSVDGELILLVLCIALLGVFLLTRKVIYSLGVEDRDPAFIVKYGLVFGCIVVSQIAFPDPEKASRIETRGRWNIGWPGGARELWPGMKALLKVPKADIVP
jgi:hypothetical protein